MFEKFFSTLTTDKNTEIGDDPSSLNQYGQYSQSLNQQSYNAAQNSIDQSYYQTAAAQANIAQANIAHSFFKFNDYHNDDVTYRNLTKLCEKHECIKEAKERLEVLIALCKETE